MSRKLILLGHYPPPVVLESRENLVEALLALDRRGVRHAVVVDSEGKLEGILSVRRIMAAVEKGYEEGSIYRSLSETTVDSIMYRDPPRVVIGEFDVESVVDLMSRLNVGAVAVVDSSNKVLGIISEKHVAGIVAQGRIYVSVHEVMSRPIRTVLTSDSLYTALKVMVENRYRHLPVVGDDDKLKAMLTAHDVLSYLALEPTMEKLRRGLDEEVMSIESISLAVEPPAKATASMDVGSVLRLMRRHGVDAIPVVDEEGRPMGIISERDVVVKLPKLVGVEMFYDTIKSRLYIARTIS